MVDCYLTDDQKNILRLIAKALQEGRVGEKWNVKKRKINLTYINDAGTQESIMQIIRKKITQFDLDDFTECGFLKQRSETIYTVRKQKIIDEVRNNFGEKRPQISPSQEHLIFSKPNTSDQFVADIFMIMPFADEFNPIYEDHIKAAANTLNLTIKRGDNFFSRQSIMNDIWSAINGCKIVIADCTDRNANVFYELGIAHAIEKTAIMITQNIEDIPFDLKHLRVIEYQHTPRGMKEFEVKLQSAITQILKDLS